MPGVASIQRIFPPSPRRTETLMETILMCTCASCPINHPLLFRLVFDSVKRELRSEWLKAKVG